MINNKNQKQLGGNSSTNLQSHSITINQGISYSDAKEIALDVYRANFLQISQDAAKLAMKRAEELIDVFLNELQKRNPDALREMRQPGMQVALYEAQKQYAKTGDKNLEQLLVDLLVERVSIPERNIRQIVLDEALTIAPKLTVEQMDILTLNFLILRTSNNHITTPETLSKYLNTKLAPFLTELRGNSFSYSHLEYTGCCSKDQFDLFTQTLNEDGSMLAKIFKDSYPIILSNGFEEDLFNEKVGDFSEYSSLLIKCFQNQERYQINASSEDNIKQKLRSEKIDTKLQDKFIELSERETQQLKRI